MRRVMAATGAIVIGLARFAAADELPEDAARLVAAFEEDAEAIRLQAEEKIAAQRAKLAVELKALQDKYTKDGKLDEAVAIRDAIRSAAESVYKSETDPGNMTGYRDQVGKVFHFRVVGSTQGPLFGTDVYTTDSSIAVAAVHAGALKPGETGIVRVTLLAGGDNYAASSRNGVTSSAWSTYPASYRVQRAIVPKPVATPLPPPPPK